jgi:hypothetical protein
MVAKTELKAVELVRDIRDRISKKLEGLSDEEVIAFYRRAGRAAPRRRAPGRGRGK